MRHVVLGAGGVGGLLAAALARSGQEVTVIVRPGTQASYPAAFRVQSAVLGDFQVEVPVVETATEPADALWVTVKATQLKAALGQPPEARLVIPLLNGIDHVAWLREVYGGRVVPGAIRVEAERVAPGHIVQPGPFLAVDLAPPPSLREPGEQLAAELEAAGIPASVHDSEAGVLWRKLALLAPLALATTSAGAAIGEVRDDPDLRTLLLACAGEVCAVAATQGVDLDLDRTRQALMGLPDSMRTSMQKDLAAGRPPEVDAIGGPIVRVGREHGISTPATDELVRRVRARSPQER